MLTTLTQKYHFLPESNQPIMGTDAFEGKYILITGASGGLGSALAKLLAEKRAKRVVTSRSGKALNELISQLPHPEDAVAITADLSVSGEAAKLATDAISTLGHIDMLINNAGVGYFALMEAERPGLCPKDTCGEPRFRIAQKALEAAAGPGGEVWPERAGKWSSTAASIWQHFVERCLAALRDKVIEKKSLENRPWRLFQVESAIACNLKCVMCPWRGMAKEAENRGIMTQAVWEAIRPHLNRVQSIDFTGGGEPLLQPRLVDWIADAKQAGCETGFLTNGLLLVEEKLKSILDAGINWICISMDGADAEMYNKIRVGSNFDRVSENVANITRWRSGKIPKTMINFVLMDINIHQMEAIVQLAARLGVDQVNFKQCDVIRGYEGKGFGLFASEETREIRRLQKSMKKARRLAKKLNVATTAFAFTPRELAVCEQDPRDSLFIRYDGSVAPCINLALGGPTTFLGEDVTMPSVHYGKLPGDDLMDLWNTKRCQFYRQKFQERVNKYDNVVVNDLIGGGGGNRAKVLEGARKAMPAPPKGCNVCHYLYDI